MRPPHLLRPDRLRSVERERPFGWLPCRLLRGELLRLMSTSTKALYLHLALAADRCGLSFWGDRRIQETIGLDAAELHQAREQLVELDLLAFDGRTYQLLSLPEPRSPVRPRGAAPSTEADPCDHVTDDNEIPEQARRILRRILGRDFAG
jgi:hypothetical protein